MLGLAIWAAGSSSTARAGIQFVDMFRNDSWMQTGNGNSLTVLGSFFSSDLYSVNSGDYFYSSRKNLAVAAGSGNLNPQP